MSHSIEQYYENEPDKNSKEKLIETILGHIENMRKFFLSDYVLQTRKQKFGFPKPEQFKVLRDIQELEKSVKVILEKDVEVIGPNHMVHILGNSILPRAYAMKFDHGDFYSVDDERKLLPIKTFEMIKVEMELVIFYIQELQSNPELIKEELASVNGYLKNFVEFLSCDMPTQTIEQLKLFKIFSELEKGEMTPENFSAISTDMQKYLDIEKIRENFAIDNFSDSSKL